MDAAEFRDTVESAAQTELDRLGSSKLLVGLTGADLSEEAVLRAAADSEAASAQIFEDWAEETSTPELSEAFESIASTERDHLDRVLAELDDYEPSGTGAIHDHLRHQTEPEERIAAGFVGRGLVALRTHTQIVSFFVNEPDERLANLFRDLKADTEDQIDEGAALLKGLAGDDEERSDGAADPGAANEALWDSAKFAAVSTIHVAYEEYADSLEDMGINPKSVC